jgi:hypothetical protein
VSLLAADRTVVVFTEGALDNGQLPQLSHLVLVFVIFQRFQQHLGAIRITMEGHHGGEKGEVC